MVSSDPEPPKKKKIYYFMIVRESKFSTEINLEKYE